METVKATPPPITDLVDLYRATTGHAGETVLLTPTEAVAVEVDIAAPYGDHLPPWRQVRCGRHIFGCTVTIVETIPDIGRYDA